MVAFWALVWCLLVQSAAGAEAYLSVEPRQLRVGQIAQARVVLTDAKADSPPVIPDSISLRASYVGSSSRSQMTPQGLSGYTHYNYRIIPLSVGEFELGPVSVQVNGAAIKTEAVSLTVRAAAIQKDEKLRIQADFSSREAWEGQVVLYHYSLASEYPVQQAPSWDLDDFSSLRPPREGDRPQSVDTRNEEGKELQVIERWIPLVVMGSHDRDFRAPLAQVVVQPVPGSRPEARLLIGEPSALKVRALPPTVTEFSGLVGEFTVHSELDRTALKAGESALWRVRIEGNGTLESLELPKLSAELPVQVYEGAVTASAAVVGGQYQAKMVSERTIVPVKEGRMELPDLILRSFSPEKEAYVDHILSFPILEVAPGAVGAGAAVSFAPTVDPSDLLPTPDPMKPLRSPMRTTPSRFGVGWPWLLVMLALAGLADLARDPYRAWRLWRARKAEAEVLPPTALELLEALPVEAAARLGGAERALRIVAADLPSGPSGEAAKRRHQELLDRLHRIRFAGTPAENCIEEIRAFVIDTSKGAEG